MSVQWPVLSSGVTPTPSGTTVRWGTGNAIAATTVISMSASEKVEVDYVPQGDGVQATRFVTKHGHKWNVTCVDDGRSFNTPPSVGSAITIVGAHLGTGNSAAMTANTYAAVVIDNDYQAARKVEGQRVIQCEFLTLADGGSGPNN